MWQGRSKDGRYATASSGPVMNKARTGGHGKAYSVANHTGSLGKLRMVWNKDPKNPDHIMLWAACCMVFFGFPRSGEMTSLEAGEFDPGQHLTVKDNAVDEVENPSVIAVKIKQSKLDPFRHGTTIYLSKTYVALCPVAALLAYFAMRGSDEGPLFILKEKLLTHPQLVGELRVALEAAGLELSVIASKLGQVQWQQHVKFLLTSSKLWGAGRARLTSFMSGSQTLSCLRSVRHWQ